MYGQVVSTRIFWGFPHEFTKFKSFRIFIFILINILLILDNNDHLKVEATKSTPVISEKILLRIKQSMSPYECRLLSEYFAMNSNDPDSALPKVDTFGSEENYFETYDCKAALNYWNSELLPFVLANEAQKELAIFKIKGQIDEGLRYSGSGNANELSDWISNLSDDEFFAGQSEGYQFPQENEPVLIPTTTRTTTRLTSTTTRKPPATTTTTTKKPSPTSPIHPEPVLGHFGHHQNGQASQDKTDKRPVGHFSSGSDNKDKNNLNNNQGHFHLPATTTSQPTINTKIKPGQDDDHHHIVMRGHFSHDINKQIPKHQETITNERIIGHFKPDQLPKQEEEAKGNHEQVPINSEEETPIIPNEEDPLPINDNSQKNTYEEMIAELDYLAEKDEQLKLQKYSNDVKVQQRSSHALSKDQELEKEILTNPNLDENENIHNHENENDDEENSSASVGLGLGFGTNDKLILYSCLGFVGLILLVLCIYTIVFTCRHFCKSGSDEEKNDNGNGRNNIRGKVNSLKSKYEDSIPKTHHDNHHHHHHHHRSSLR